jgi:hypothetical protein
MSETRLVNIKYEKCDFYIGRGCHWHCPSVWRNPFHIGRDGNREVVIKKYEKYIRNALANSHKLRMNLLEMDGKVLGCHCKQPDREVACHGDILIKLIEEFKEKI